jgi:hypothetical protein
MQTSIEWLIDRIKNQHLTLLSLDKLQEQAKEMHKQEIIKSNRDGVDMVIDNKRFITGEGYYSETFNKD